MSQSFAKRFYKDVSVDARDDGYVILLDGRVLKTPNKADLIINRRKRADIVAAEWDAQETEINPSLMPATRLMNVACEQTPLRREALISEARNYAATDLLCYRADAPADLAARQAQHWDPLLHWAAAQDIKLETVIGIMAIRQSPAALDALATKARTMDDVALTLLVHFISVFGSAVLGLAVMNDHITATRGLELSRLDELYQIEQWGEDEDAKLRIELIWRETLALATLI